MLLYTHVCAHAHTCKSKHILHYANRHRDTLTECGSLVGGLFGFFSLATAAACELIAFIKPELSVNPVVAEVKITY